jgi:hypothetical protein
MVFTEQLPLQHCHCRCRCLLVSISLCLLQFEPLFSHSLFTRSDHVNTLAVSDNTALAMLHGSGEPSKIVQFDIETGIKQVVIDNVGFAAHGLVLWENFVVVLDSRGGALKLVDLVTRSISTVWQQPAKFLKVFLGVSRCACHMPRCH